MAHCGLGDPPLKQEAAQEAVQKGHGDRPGGTRKHAFSVLVSIQTKEKRRTEEKGAGVRKVVARGTLLEVTRTVPNCHQHILHISE